MLVRDGLGMRRGIMVVVCLSIMIAVAIRSPMVWAKSSIIRVPQDYPTIKQALNASGPGDTIIVSEGTYPEGEIWITKPNITLVANGAVVVDGLRKGWVFYVIADNVTINGFKVVNSIFGWNYAGICLDHARNCKVLNNKVEENSEGIFLFASSHNILDNNTLSSNGGNGIRLGYSSNNTIKGNVATNNRANGIYIGSSHGNVLVQNYASNNSVIGISLADARNNVLYNNTVSYHREGIFLAGHSGGTVMSGNSMIDNSYNLAVSGEYLQDFMNDIDSSNLVDGKRVYYLKNHNEITIDPSVFPDLGYLGIINSSMVTVRNIAVSNNFFGVFLAFVTNATVENVNVTKNHYGIYLHGCSNNTLTGNRATENGYGIELLGGAGRHTVTRNYLVNNKIGIRLGSGSHNSLLYNIVTNNSWAGIQVVGYDNIIRGNLVVDNAYELGLPPGGITLEGGRHIVCENNIANNGFGMFLMGAGNTIYHNNFVNNAIQVTPGPAGYVNIWDDGYPSGGNYWSDYNGTDVYSGFFQNVTGSDSIGDNPYAIDEDNQDHYPLVKPWGPTHEVAVLSVAPSTNVTHARGVININVTVQNQGELTETFTVTAYYNDQPIEVKTVSNLASGKTATLTFSWKIVDVPLYTDLTIKAEASPVFLEADTTNNILTNGTVYVMMMGDLNGDRTVNIYDIVMAADAYGSSKGDPSWNPLADLAPQWGIINIYDLVTCAYHYLETYP
jgi:parallel beta-helix repeat protein